MMERYSKTGDLVEESNFEYLKLSKAENDGAGAETQHWEAKFGKTNL